MSAPAREETLDVETATWLVTRGLDHVRAACESLSPGGRDQLARLTALRKRGLTAQQAAAVEEAAAARVALGPSLAQAGWRDASQVVLSRVAAEQASHPQVSTHRAARFGDVSRVTDLGCGAGIDAISLALTGCSVTGVDLDPGRLILAQHNAHVAGTSIDWLEGDAMSIDVAGHWHSDPGRRREGKRARMLADTQPPSGELVRRWQASPGGALVVSPGVSLDDTDLPAGEIEFIQVGRELTEAVVWMGDRQAPGVEASATILTAGAAAHVVHRLERSGPAPSVAVGPVRRHLLVPQPALARTRLHHQLILELGGHRISDRRALCTSDQSPTHPQWWEDWLIEAELPGRPRAVRAWLKGRDTMPLSIQMHGDAGDIATWWSGLGRVQRGPIGRRLHVVVTEHGTKALVTVPAG